MTFVSKPIVPAGGVFDAGPLSHGEPALPGAFEYGDDRLEVATVRRTWRSTKTDRGDVYLKRHWFEFETPEGRVAVVYFDRGAARGAPRWYLYTIEEGEGSIRM